MRLISTRRALRAATMGAMALLMGVGPALADGGVTFTDIALNGGAGINYSRLWTPDRMAPYNAVVATAWPLPLVPNFFPNAQVVSTTRQFGNAGLVAFDYDKDGDQDLYVVNGPGRANSLFQNRFAQTGSVTFVEVAAAAGVAATTHDSQAACYGDIDNDGDEDLMVVNGLSYNILYRNNGNGTFTDISNTAGIKGPGDVMAIGCGFGDIDNDGYLDVTVGVNLKDWYNRFQTFLPGDSTGLRQSQLYKSNGDGTFTDISATSGVRNLVGRAGGSWNWVSSFVDIDHDGDADLINANMQGPPSGLPITPGQDPAQVRGWLRVFENDGTGHFTDVSQAKKTDIEGGWMGLAFADFDCNGRMDMAVSNLGDYMGAPFVFATSWFLQQEDGTFEWPYVGDKLKRTPFGWGMATFDYDNDGDSDIMFHGGGDNLQFNSADNPGTLLRNDGLCSASFSYDAGAVLRDHRPRHEDGLVVADFNNDGFDDMASAANVRWTPIGRYLPFAGFFVTNIGSPFDAIARFQVNFNTLGLPGFMTYAGPNYVEGDLSVEINSANNGNHWVQFSTIGTAGIVGDNTDLAKINRSGIGAIVQFTPLGGPTSMRVQVGGESYSSQNSHILGFGMGEANFGTVDVTWPGGFKNRLYNVTPGEKITLPAIPCSFEGNQFSNYGQFNSCVTRALNEFRNANVISNAERTRWRNSMTQAWNETH